MKTRHAISSLPEQVIHRLLAAHSQERIRPAHSLSELVELVVFAVFLLCVLRDTLCLTPVMGCAHMDDHRACRVTSVHTLSTTTKED